MSQTGCVQKTLFESLRVLRVPDSGIVSGAELHWQAQDAASSGLDQRFLDALHPLFLPDLPAGELAARVRSQAASYRAMHGESFSALNLALAGCSSVCCDLLGGGASSLSIELDESGQVLRLRFDHEQEYLHSFAVLYSISMLNQVFRDGKLDQRLVQVLELAGRYFLRDYQLDSSQDDLLDTFSEQFPVEVVNTFVNFLYPNSEHLGNSLFKVLILEDNRPLAEVFCDMLSSFGYVVYQAYDGVEGLDRVESDSFDLIVSDIQMPNLDGLSFLGVLRNLKPGIPVIITTGYTGIWEAREILDLGAVAFLPKPFTMQDLIHTVNRIVHGEEP